jgi:hypothetical protein
MDVAASLRELLRVQESRAQAYARMHAGFRKLTGGAAGAAGEPGVGGGGSGGPAEEAAFATLLGELTAEFSQLSQRARDLETALLSSSAPQAAQIVRAAQDAERDKLNLTLALQRLRRPFALGAFSWQQQQQKKQQQSAGVEDNDAGIGGPLDPVEVARQRARGCGCGHGGGHGHDHGKGEKDQEAPPPPEPTEEEWRGAVSEAVRELDLVVGRINDALDEARQELLDLEGEGEEEGKAAAS